MAQDNDAGMKNTGAPSAPTNFQFKLDFTTPAELVPVKHANQLIVQVYGEEVNISFFQLTAPVVAGTPEQQREQIGENVTLRPECVARINISLQVAELLLKSLDANLKIWQQFKATQMGGKT